ncbi:MAG: signal peptidase II [Spirochaetaceae bacterium]|jgi:signal peptidase II|nr:signal peptidase II [Spirochaetaceae bacterium]
MKINREKMLPFLLTGFLILLDQMVKAFIVKNWPGEGVFISDVFDNDFLWIIHVRNKAVAFSLGENLPEYLQPALFIILPLVVLFFLVWYYFKSADFSRLQRWAVAGIIGGGMGNIIDRIFRPGGVVDYISIKFYGLLGLSRWPTFNIADASVVICGIILLFTIMISPKQTQEVLDEQKN